MEQKMQEDPNYNPLITHYGEHLRLLDQNEGKSIAEYIIENYIKPEYFLTDEDFKDIAYMARQEKYLPMITSNDPEIKSKYKDFEYSNGFIHDFKMNNRIDSRKFRLKRRLANPTLTYQNEFVNEIKDFLSISPRDHIFYCDETGYALVPKGILTWFQVNVDQNSQQSAMNDKEQITVLATITAANTKLPLTFIAEGLTEKIEKSQIGCR